jgi:glycosyltransferase involved in cell wall biosynthesis/predicted SAM-dependent methyltransferase
MDFYIYSPVHFEQWDYRTPDKRGIGGSEISHIEMCWRLARRGHRVFSYAPIPKNCPPEWRGVKWFPLEKATFKEPGIWVIYRSPETLEKMEPKKNHQEVWFVSQDEWYPSWKPKYAKKIDRFFALCTAHANNILKHHKELEGKVFLTSNGIKMDLIRDIEASGTFVRNPHKLIYASSPDRGLKYLLSTFKKSREFIPDLELHVFYGFNNIDKLIKKDIRMNSFKKMKDEIIPLLKQPGVIWRGRATQAQLYREWLTAGIWCYQTNFTETSCITSMEAQALGAIPITNPLWALKDNVKHGIFIQGDAYSDPLIQARYAAEIVRLASVPQIQNQIRVPMMKEARLKFNWERYVDQWEAYAYRFDMSKYYISQYNFQLKHSHGKVINIGCDIDSADLKHQRNALNIDIVKETPILKIPTKVDVVADARDLPSRFFGKFDTAILGDILEHMNDEDIVKSLVSAKKCLKKNGRIVITCPEDYRPHDVQHAVSDNSGYADGISSYHERPITREMMEALIKKAGLTTEYWERLDYTMFLGNAYVVR